MSTASTLEHLVTDRLEADERILWHGKAEHTPLLEGAYRSRILIKWAVSLAVIGGLTVAYFRSSSTVKPTDLAIIAAILLFLLLAPVLEWRKTLALEYFLTDRRAFLIQGGLTVYSMPLVHADQVKILPMDNGNSCLLLGTPAVEEGAKQLRWRAVNPFKAERTSSDSEMVAMMLYNLKDAQTPANILLDSKNS